MRTAVLLLALKLAATESVGAAEVQAQVDEWIETAQAVMPATTKPRKTKKRKYARRK